MGMGAVWAGSGASLPSVQQLALISALKPTVWMGMSSYGLHLANLANSRGVDLAESPVSTMLCSAEALSAAKREKLERDWGATVFDCFGMTEISMLAAEGPSRQGFRIWTDLAIFEVLDPDTGKPVPDGEAGHLVSTALFGNNGAPFLRWDSGDIVIMNPAGGDDGAVLGLPDDAPRPPHGGFLQAARRQRQPPGVRGHDVRAPFGERLQARTDRRCRRP